jgi:hypothetical protein
MPSLEAPPPPCQKCRARQMHGNGPCVGLARHLGAYAAYYRDASTFSPRDGPSARTDISLSRRARRSLVDAVLPTVPCSTSTAPGFG